MQLFIKRAAIGAAVVALAVTSLALTGAPAATGQEAAGPVPVEILAAPPAGAEAAGPQASQGSPGNATHTGTAPEATIAASPAFEGQPIGGESVIGADGRQQVTDTTTYPARAIGQIELTDFFGDQFICTGWLIDANTVLTSGHCAYIPDPSGALVIQSASFFPGRNGGSNPFGGCAVTSAFAKAGWRVQGRAKDDWAIMQLNCNIGDTVGSLGYFTVPGENQLDGKTGRVEGYPGDKPPGTHWKMSGTMHSRSNADMIHYTLDTAGGQSGSPIMVANRPACGGPCGMGIHSYGSGGNPLTNSGPRITGANFNLIEDIANDNG